MMKGQIFNLAKSFKKEILAFKENKDGLSFYTASLEKVPENEDIRIEKTGVFTNFYPCDQWLLKVAESFLNNPPPDFTPCRDKEETLERIFRLCKEYTGEEEIKKTFKNHEGLDPLHYMEEGVRDKKDRKRKFDDSDTSFFLYRVKKIADSVEGDGVFLSESGKKLLLSLAFLEKDMVRCVKRGDTNVLFKRAEDAANKYLDYYYDEDADFLGKGKISRAFGNFLKVIFFLSGSNALQDDKFIV